MYYSLKQLNYTMIQSSMSFAQSYTMLLMIYYTYYTFIKIFSVFKILFDHIIYDREVIRMISQYLCFGFH